MAKVMKCPLLMDGEFEVEEVVDLNFFNLKGIGTKGSNNKSYAIELHKAKKGKQAQIFSQWGPTGGHQSLDWRHFDSFENAKKEFDKIIRSKKKKGYKEVDIAKKAVGSDEAKKIVKPVQFINLNSDKNVNQSSLHPKIQYLMGELFGSTSSWVTQILKCPLGQLTNVQINRGRDILQEAQLINKKKQKSKNDKSKIEELTNDFYSSIPHNLGTGARGQMMHLLLDDTSKIAQKEADLDTLLDAKSVGAVLTDSSVDARYKELNADLEYVEESDVLFNWINDLVLKTRASNHRYLGKIKILNVWKLKRHNKENEFLDRVRDIAKACKGQIIPNMYKNLSVDDRKDIIDNKLFQNANVLPLFHGTRTENLIGITKKGLLIRPHNAVLTGAMYGNACYTSTSSSKSINYTNIKSSYWARGGDDKAFLFLTDTILGDSKITQGASNYTRQNIKPYHSVWAKGGHSGVINDEMMVYDIKQIMLRYLIEFTCQKN